MYGIWVYGIDSGDIIWDCRGCSNELWVSSNRFLHFTDETLKKDILDNFDSKIEDLERIPVICLPELPREAKYAYNINEEAYVGRIKINTVDQGYKISFCKDLRYHPLTVRDLFSLDKKIGNESLYTSIGFKVKDIDIIQFLKDFLIEREDNSMRENLNIIFEGVAGSGKSYLLKELRESNFYGENGNRIEVVVFHPSTSYEEFVSGIRPNFGKESGEGDFVTQEGTFIQMCNRAAEDPDNPYLLFIDEINRANTSRVFGDLMLVLEKSKRQDFKYLSVENRDGALFEAEFQQMPGEYVRLQTPIFKNGKEYNKLAVPSNLHVLGTMNTTDRSVGTIDLALRRRFHWITQHPYTAEELKEAMVQANETYPDSIASWYENANNILLEKVGPDARLGHAYFFGKEGNEEAIAEALLNQLKEVAFTFNISQSILDEIGMVGGKRIIIRGSGLGARPDIVTEFN